MSNELKRKEIEKKIEMTRIQLQSQRKEVEIKEAYLRGLEEVYENLFNPVVIRVAENNQTLLSSSVTNVHSLREGTEISKVMEIIKRAGRPMHVKEILVKLGTNDKKKKISLTGTLNQYSKKNKIFTKTASNTYGVL